MSTQAEAPKYLGMCRAVFNEIVRPHVREFPIGKQGVGFDRLELDAWADAYIATHSIDKCAPYQKALPSESHAALKRPQVTSSKSNTARAPDPHANTIYGGVDGEQEADIEILNYECGYSIADDGKELGRCAHHADG